MQRTVAFYTLGCKLNFAETSTIARDLEQQGFQKVPFQNSADLYVINTCSVTENADKKFRSVVRQAQKSNPEAYIAVVGCYAQLQPDQIAAIPGVDLVLGATEKFKIGDYLEDLDKQDHGKVHSCEISEADFYVSSYAIGDRTRAFLKVQDGCDYKCTYCTIPLARGISRSDTFENVLQNAAEISQKGIREIVLTGVNIGDYGKGEFGNKKHEHTFLQLVQGLDAVPGIERLRISSIEPNLLQNEIIDFVAGSRCFVPHFHIPLQSGSNTILRRMRRRYMRELYAERVERIRSVMPNACIGVDVIVGFPGETEAHFLETYEFLLSLEISYLHVFTYSERPDTLAADMDGVVSQQERKRRSKMLRSLSAKKRRTFYESQLGTDHTVLFEGENKKGYIHGFTENYVKVKAPWNPELVNTLHRIRLEAIDSDGLVRFQALEPISIP
ncbi:tRNA (N(6)-L-threonylcarbamoyladenosine(37)-C(2))-methylthiotransferase MtaB [Robiginitalea aurantiaca]|uniref:tRNA (N(6)-L-threonylcarbamoyladenosine(37)-C(2))-methylthiotransferase MtaB n=1 Tax=Robiginitalea aurantiaca TaxID=3056915 RepID=A0ABT7WCF1_9FLAO|nr:tRNA (N(6)-L-threonylcarbamoyladenosine(37)-C(2))-methylthiotransferase MtaB [Robiginitalea aurantiaca]MDM9630578.1 tRNA (N(6)-L-threonylcarbamoyladenosine(37)-C(2))-methylthiotransferase MtaB [Robiginitalea aurantiaca]